MKTIVLTSEQVEIFKQSIILQVRALKKDIHLNVEMRDKLELDGNFTEALSYSKKLSGLYENLEQFYDILFKLAQS